MSNSTELKYRHLDEVAGAQRAAKLIIPVILDLVGPVNSVVDLGGGTGAWLKEFSDRGVAQITLYDHPSAEASLLIPAGRFRKVNLELTMPAVDRSDLAVCVECAEHLSSNRAYDLVEWLTSTSDRVVFSAAIIGQGGKRHINEQFAPYWRDIFRSFGFVRRDVIRRRILTEAEIPWWYRQNLFLFVKEGTELQVDDGDFIPDEFSLIHNNIEKAFSRPRVKSIPEYVSRSLKGYFIKRGWLRDAIPPQQRGR